jgi:hypothetical protein
MASFHSLKMEKTLILSPRYTPDSIALRDAALELGWSVERLSSWRVPVHLEECNAVPYGEPLFAAVVAEPLQLALIEPRLSWVAEIPFDLRRRELQFTNLATARTLERPRFLKPADDKAFPAKVYGSGGELPSNEMLGASTPVLVSEPVSWEAEFRCFVLEKQIAAISVYSRWGELAESEDGNWTASDLELKQAADFASGVLCDSRVSFPPAGVLDVGIIKDMGWAVVETNACWGSGIYGCDPCRVLETLARAWVKKTALSDADRRWVIERTPIVG